MKGSEGVALLSGREEDVVVVARRGQSVRDAGALVLHWTAANGLLGGHVPHDHASVVLTAEREQVEVIGREGELKDLDLVQDKSGVYLARFKVPNDDVGLKILHVPVKRLSVWSKQGAGHRHYLP